VRCHALQVLRSQSAALNEIANGRAFRAARSLIVPGQKPCGGTQDSCRLGNTNFGNARFWLLREAPAAGIISPRTGALNARLAAPGNRKLLGQFRHWAPSPEMLHAQAKGHWYRRSGRKKWARVGPQRYSPRHLRAGWKPDPRRTFRPDGPRAGAIRRRDAG
jgi:hypothetical protein